MNLWKVYHRHNPSVYVIVEYEGYYPSDIKGRAIKEFDKFSWSDLDMLLVRKAKPEEIPEVEDLPVDLDRLVQEVHQVMREEGMESKLEADIIWSVRKAWLRVEETAPEILDELDRLVDETNPVMRGRNYDPWIESAVAMIVCNGWRRAEGG